MLKTEIIKETAAVYNSANRALDAATGDCMYLTNDGKKCAVGRCMAHPTITMTGSVGTLRENYQHYLSLEDELLPDYRGHSLDFWDGLQRFHDTPHFWTSTGLSGSGQEYLDYLLTAHKY